MSDCPVFEQFMADVQPDAGAREQLRAELSQQLMNVVVAENLVTNSSGVPAEDSGTFGTEFG